MLNFLIVQLEPQTGLLAEGKQHWKSEGPGADLSLCITSALGSKTSLGQNNSVYEKQGSLEC